MGVTEMKERKEEGRGRRREGCQGREGKERAEEVTGRCVFGERGRGRKWR